MCTIASMPRLPEHCIEYVRILLWPKEMPFGGRKSHHITDIYIFFNNNYNYEVVKPVNRKYVSIFVYFLFFCLFVLMWIR